MGIARVGAAVFTRHDPMMGAPVQRYRLRDGTPVLVRPILPEDKGRMQDGLRRLSPESRYHRFMAAISELSDEQLRYLTEVDGVNHIAWVALDPERPGQPGLGVARCIRLESDPEIAEVAVTVVDSHQGRGLGTLLLGLLSRSAAAHGIRTFRAYVLEDNAAVLRIFHDLGATVEREDRGVLRVDVPVLGDPDELSDTPTGRVFRAIAGGVCSGTDRSRGSRAGAHAQQDV